MFEDPDDEQPVNRPHDPKVLAKDKIDEFRMHAEFVAVFEGVRKFSAEIVPGLDAETARDVQRTMGKLEKAKPADSPMLPEPAGPDAAKLLTLPRDRELSLNDYHIQRRPGEVMIVRWMDGDLVQAFYERLQAHFDAALNQFRDEERQAQEWKQDSKTLAYLKALEETEVKMEDRYLRSLIHQHKIYVLSTQSADELDIIHLTDYVMGVEPAKVVGAASAPPEEPTERDRAWFFKLFSLRGMVEDEERMCFFTFLQKTDDDNW